MNIFTTLISAVSLMMPVLWPSAIPTQRISNTSVRIVKQSTDSALVAVTWTQSNADTVRVAWTYPGASTTRVATGTRRADTLRVARGTVAQSATVTLTPKRGSLTGTQRSSSISIPAKPIPVVQPTIDTIRIDTLPSVVVPPVIPPVVVPPVSSAFTPNLPTGLSKIVDTKFSAAEVALSSGGSSGINYWNWASPESICRNVGDTLEVTYPGNHLGNGTGGCLIEGPESYKWTEVYFAMSVFVPSNYSMHSNAEKWLYMLTTSTVGSTAATLIEWMPQSGESPNGNTFGLQLMPATIPSTLYPQPTGSPWYWISQTPGTTRVTKGVWHIIEASFTMNTPGQQNGVYRIWLDGSVVISGNNALFREGAAQGYFTGIRFDGTRGGGASTSPTPAGGQIRRYSRLAWYAR